MSNISISGNIFLYHPQGHQILYNYSHFSVLHSCAAICENNYINRWKFKQKHKHSRVFKYLLFDWLAHSTKLVGVG